MTRKKKRIPKPDPHHIPLLCGISSTTSTLTERVNNSSKSSSEF